MRLTQLLYHRGGPSFLTCPLAKLNGRTGRLGVREMDIWIFALCLAVSPNPRLQDRVGVRQGAASEACLEEEGLGWTWVHE